MLLQASKALFQNVFDRQRFGFHKTKRWMGPTSITLFNFSSISSNINVLWLNISSFSSIFFFFFFERSYICYLSMYHVNVYFVIGFRPFRPNYFTCTAHLYLYCTLLVPHTYASYIRHWCIFFSLRNTIQSFSISNMVSEPLL